MSEVSTQTSNTPENQHYDEYIFAFSDVHVQLLIFYPSTSPIGNLIIDKIKELNTSTRTYQRSNPADKLVSNLTVMTCEFEGSGYDKDPDTCQEVLEEIRQDLGVNYPITQNILGVWKRIDNEGNSPGYKNIMLMDPLY